MNIATMPAAEATAPQVPDDEAQKRAIATAVWTDLLWLMPPDRTVTIAVDDTIPPVAASNTKTPTGEVSIRVSRSFRARCSPRWARAFTIAAAACEANSTSTSSSASVKTAPPAFAPRKK